MTSHVVDRHHHLEGARVEEVADQHAGGVAEHGVGGVAAAPQFGFVDHVVVQQRGGVDEFDHRGELVVLRAPDSRSTWPTAAPAPGAGACRRRR